MQSAYSDPEEDDRVELVQSRYKMDAGDDSQLLPNSKRPMNATPIRIPVNSGKDNIPVGFSPCGFSDHSPLARNALNSKRKRPDAPGEFHNSDKTPRKLQRTPKQSPKRYNNPINVDETDPHPSVRSQTKARISSGLSDFSGTRSDYFKHTNKDSLSSLLKQDRAPSSGYMPRDIHGQRQFDVPRSKIQRTSEEEDTSPSSELDIIGLPIKLIHGQHNGDTIQPTSWTSSKQHKKKSNLLKGGSATVSRRAGCNGKMPELQIKEFRRGKGLHHVRDRILFLKRDNDGDFQIHNGRNRLRESEFAKNAIISVSVSEDGGFIGIDMKEKLDYNEHSNAIYISTEGSREEVEEIFYGFNIETKKPYYFKNLEKSLRASEADRNMQAQRRVQPEDHGTRSWEITRITRSKNESQPKASISSILPQKRPVQDEDILEVPVGVMKRNARSTRSFLATARRPEEVSLSRNPKLSPWKLPLVWPVSGRKRVTVDFIDLDRLDDGEFLNDNIINFYLRYLEVQLYEKNPELAQRCHFFNTFFYERLNRKNPENKRDISSLLKWTAGTDLFSKHFIIVPINENTHWYLALICNSQHISRKLDLEKEKEANWEVEMRAVREAEKKAKKKAEREEKMPDISEEEHDNGSDDFKQKLPETPETEAEQEESVSESEPRGIKTVERSADDIRLVKEIQDAQRRHEMEDTNISFDRMSVDDEQQCLYEEDVREVEALLGESTPTKNHDVIEVLNSTIEATMPVKASKKSTKAAKPKKPPKTYEPDTPAIFILDSLNTRGHQNTFTVLREYLREEGINKKKLDIPASKDFIVGCYPDVPVQPNFCDCGVYLLYYVEKFLERPEDFTREFLLKKKESNHLHSADISRMRSKLGDLILDLKRKQGDEEPPPTPKVPKEKPELQVVISTKNERRNASEDIQQGSYKREDSQVDAETPRSGRSKSVPDGDQDIVEIQDTHEVVEKVMPIMSREDHHNEECRKRIPKQRPKTPNPGRSTRALANGRLEIPASPEGIKGHHKEFQNSFRLDDSLEADDHGDPPLTKTSQQDPRVETESGKHKAKIKPDLVREELNDMELQSKTEDAEKKAEEEQRRKVSRGLKSPAEPSTLATEQKKRPRKSRSIEKGSASATYEPDVW